ncbi:uncharacterized protein [Trachinotus anak]|uniref:uncharacterized protein isoform X1 n=1 Tax=Trachinotus anak TaxID=443729 RepID=UPI0039F193B1
MQHISSTMVDNIGTKSAGLILIAAAHMIFKGSSQAEVTGTLGSNVTLKFRFNGTVLHPDSHFAIYITGQRKIAELNNKVWSGEGVLDIYPKNTVLYHITNLRLNHSEIYWASLFVSGFITESNKVQLIVQEENRSSTVPPLPTNITINEYSGSSSFFSFHIVIVLVVLPVVLLAATLLCLIWCLMRTKDKQRQPQQENSNPTVQETVQEANRVPPPSLVYSVLDFPKRPSAVLEMNLNDTEYAAVNYLPEKRV